MLTKAKVLIVSEDPDFAVTIKKHLMGFPIEITTVESAEKAIELSYAEGFAILITGYALTDITGLDVVSFIRKTPQNMNIPSVILFDKMPDEVTFARAQKFGLLEFLSIPYSASSITS